MADAWMVLVRPKQPTFGALVLICKEPAQAFSAISPEAFADLSVAVGAVERLLRGVVNYDKINYMMLMMVDPHVHLHVVPRYAAPRAFEGVDFLDPGWPRMPDLTHSTVTDDPLRGRLVGRLRTAWPRH